jgi:hypothetical protein
MSHPKILLCLDTDPQPSVFDGVVAVDAGVDHLFRHGDVEPSDVEGLVHGAMFTRGPAELRHTAVFIGGSDVAAGEALLAAATRCFFGPMRVSVLLDSNGSNTTAAAAVIAAGRHAPLASGTTATIIGTGPVGQRAALMLAGEGVRVRIASRKRHRADELCQSLSTKIDAALLEPMGQDETSLAEMLDGAGVLIAAGPAGVEVVPADTLATAKSLRVAIDLNAAPPLGIGGFEVMDKAVERHGCACYGAIGVGGAKMKLHKAALRRLFESNDAVLDAAEVYALGKSLE